MTRTIRIGHTGITWPSDALDDAIRAIGSLGYHGIELFGWDVQSREESGQSIKPILEESGIPYAASYCSASLVNPADRAEAVRKCARWAEVTKSLGGSVIVLGGDAVDRNKFEFAEHRENVVRTINAIGQRAAEMGIVCCFHPHTGTPVESEGEIRSVMDTVDRECVKFAPDVGQIRKGGSDPAKILSDYLPLVKHLHLKDFVGGQVSWTEEGDEVDRTGFLDYEIIGRGVIDIGDMMDMLEGAGFDGYAMVELDGTHFSATWQGPPPMTPEDAAKHARDYLKTIGYSFRAV